MNKPFFDVHCHLFNLVDVPLWETISGAMKMHTLVGLASILKGPSILSEQRYFIRFFERSPQSNLLWLSKQINDALNKSGGIGEIRDMFDSIVITPLIMDFDTHIESLECMPGDETVESQYHRLDDAIVESNTTLASLGLPVRAFPFMGLALDKFNKSDSRSKLQAFQAWWEAYGMSSEERKLPWNQMPQKAIGIKLYPALGFQPYPDSRARDIYLEFYSWCITKDIPLTVHCQPGAFDPDNLAGGDKNSSPLFWKKVLETDGMKTLRINFAHFGGGGNIPNLLESTSEMNAKNETSIIVSLLRDYPNTFADLAAIDFSNPAISRGFADLLTKDLHQELRNKHSLCAKLIWGSDVPMVIESSQFHRGPHNNGPEMGYIHCLEYFVTAVSRVKSIEMGQPYSLSQRRQGEIFRAIMYANPDQFLRGRSESN